METTCFNVNGRLLFRCWANEHFEKLCNGIVPIGESFPSIYNEEILERAHQEAQRIITLLDLRNGALNFDFIITPDKKIYFLEIGPRNGGCLIPDVIKYATGIDMIKLTVDSALGIACNNLKIRGVDGYWSSYMIHSIKNGKFKKVDVSENLSKNIVDMQLWVKTGDDVFKYAGSNHILGTMILKFDSKEEMINKMDNMENYVKVSLY